MHILLYLIGGFMVVLGLGTLIAREPVTGLIFIGILVLAGVVAAALVRADDRKPYDESVDQEEN